MRFAVGELDGELAQELYEIFDPAALIVRRFGGTVDAYLGDGFMATFTGGAPVAESALAAVRTAVVKNPELYAQATSTTTTAGTSTTAGSTSSTAGSTTTTAAAAPTTAAPTTTTSAP